MISVCPIVMQSLSKGATSTFSKRLCKRDLSICSWRSLRWSFTLPCQPDVKVQGRRRHKTYPIEVKLCTSVAWTMFFFNKMLSCLLMLDIKDTFHGVALHKHWLFSLSETIQRKSFSLCLILTLTEINTFESVLVWRSIILKATVVLGGKVNGKLHFVDKFLFGRVQTLHL